MMREPSRDVRVLGLFDEYRDAVGKVGVIEAAMGLGAGYGFQLLVCVQGLNQMVELQPEGQGCPVIALSNTCKWLMGQADRRHFAM